MRHPLILFAFLLSFSRSIAAIGAPVGVPGAISQAFSSRYPAAHHIKWRQQNQTYIASFVQNDHRSCAYYDADGRWIQTATKLKKRKALSNRLLQILQSTPYATWTIEHIFEVSNADGTKTTAIDVSIWINYEIGQFEAHRLYFSPDGTLIRTENR